jgi:hypothetical protein
MTDATELMRSIGERYRAKTGLALGDYSIFYSRIVASHLLILGWNPGGDPKDPTYRSLESQSYYEDLKHDYVEYEFDPSYPMALAMCRFLRETLELRDSEPIRRIPKTNLIFRRSRGQADLPIREVDALKESQKFLEEIICRVRPSVVLLEGIKTLRAFEKHYCSDIVNLTERSIITPNGSSSARIYELHQARVHCLGREVRLLGIGHPSRYARRAAWALVVQQAKSDLQVYAGDLRRSVPPHSEG